MKNEKDTLENLFIPIWEDNDVVIHPALDFVNGKVYTSQYLKYLNQEEKKKILTLITSDKETIIIKDDDVLKELNIEFSYLPNKIENRWSNYSIQKYLNGSCPEITIQDIYSEIREKITEYIDLPDNNMYDFIACWIIGTYFHPLFNTYPYIYLNAVKRAGKTKLLTLLSCLCFNAKMALSMTPATMFRLIQGNRCTLLIDETENLKSKEYNDFRSMLLSGYKKGMKVPRAQEMKGRKAFEVNEYEVFAPKVLANISGIEDVLEDRCITLVLLRTNNYIIGNKEIDIADKVWQDIRDKLYINLLNNWKDIKKSYDLLSDTFLSNSEVSEVSEVSEGDNRPINTNNQNNKKLYIESIYKTTLTTLTTKKAQNTLKNEKEGINQEPKNENFSVVTEKSPKNSSTLTTLTTLDINTLKNKLKNIKNRDLELWLPVLSVGLSISDEVFDRVITLCVKNVKEKETENATESTDSIIIEVLSEVVDKNDWYPVKKITSRLRDYMGLDEKEDKWLNTKYVGRALKRLRFNEKRRVGTGIEYRISVKNIEDLAKRSGMRLEKFIKKEEQIILGETNEKNQ